MIPVYATMKEMDYIIVGRGRQITITAGSDRAKRRTPEPLIFDESVGALAFVRSISAEGFRFSGQELIDPDHKRLKYVYFVRTIGGRFEPAGQDWGPAEPVFEPGDVYPGGPRNGQQAVVLAVVKGESARANGGEVMVLLEARPVEGGLLINAQHPPKLEAAYREAIRRFAEHQKEEEDRVARYGEIRPQISMEFQGSRFVAVGGRLYFSKNWKYFPDFLKDYVPGVFGKEWGEAELAKPEAQRHQIVQWRSLAIRFMNEQTPQPDGRFAAIPNGFLAAYMAFAYDLYTVADNGRLDDLVLQRLKHRDQFQGARHELFAEATCLRAGYSIEREDERDRTRRHAEFTARHRGTGQLISVEAKSKHRQGVLGRPGDPPAPDKFSVRFGELLNDALRKHPPHPLVVFIDTNLPIRAAERVYSFRSVNPLLPSRIMEALIARVRTEHAGRDPYALLVFTNHPHHYGNPNEVDPGKHIISIMSQGVPVVVANPLALAAIHQAANLYGNIPNEFPRADR
jgi:hypothetical protein